jgi:hypothetical protein
LVVVLVAAPPQPKNSRATPRHSVAVKIIFIR